MDLLKILDDEPYTIEQEVKDCFKQEYVEGKLFKKPHYKETFQGLWNVLTIYVNGQETLIQGSHLFKCIPMYDGPRYQISINEVTQPISQEVAKDFYNQILTLYTHQKSIKKSFEYNKEKQQIIDKVQQRLNHTK